MNRTERNKRDHLSEFINPGLLEQAPEGFTEKVMSEISLETLNKVSESRRSKYIVPVFAAGITAVLTITALFLKGSNLTGKPEFRLPWNLDFSLPVIDFSKFLDFSLPSVIGYIFIGILLLSIFDKALFNLFHHRSEANQ